MTDPRARTLPVAVVHGGTDPAAMVPTVRSLQAAHPDLELVLTTITADPSLPLGFAVVPSLADALNRAAADHPGRDLLVVHQPVLVPPGFLDRAVAIVEDDFRVGAVAFWSNDAAHLSFPVRNVPSNHQVPDHDETTITERLRTLGPPPAPVVIGAVAGGAVLLSRWALSADPWFVRADEGPMSSALTVADHALRSQQRGFLSVLDPGTYVTRAHDLALAVPDPVRADHGRHWLHHRHRSFPYVFDSANDAAESALGIAHRLSHAKVRGLRVGIDGSCLGPLEMGTQVQTMSLVAALAEHPEVASVVVGIPGHVPGYARRALDHPKIQLRGIDGAAPVIDVEHDVLHRPFQPDRPLPWEEWERWAGRTVVTVQDVIAYQIGSYQPNGELWRNYRRDLRRSIGRADGVVVISHDVVRHLDLEQLPYEPDRLAVVGNGTDHLAGDEPEVMPRALAAGDLAAARFLLVLGANYSHKNRDLAVRAHALVRQAHPDVALVLVGAIVPHGSSRAAEVEALAATGREGVVVLPDVSSEERNWLLRHAEAVLYPTAAEGFGLVPFEAARFGTPTVEVPFGPLAEVLPDLPVTAADWSPAALAEATGALLADPAVAEAQVRAIQAGGERHRWSSTAGGLVEFYRALLARPARIRRATSDLEEYA